MKLDTQLPPPGLLFHTDARKSLSSFTPKAQVKSSGNKTPSNFRPGGKADPWRGPAQTVQLVPNKAGIHVSKDVQNLKL